MELINLDKTTKTKQESKIYDYCGGRIKGIDAFKAGGVGVAGLAYMHGLEALDADKKYVQIKSNIEAMSEGYGFYLRDGSGNYLLLIREDEILNVSFEKEADLIKPRSSFSLFAQMMNRGVPFHYSKLLLMEDEIIEENPPMLKMITHQLDEVNFKITRINPFKIKSYFERSSIQDKLIVDYSSYEHHTMV